MDPLTLQLLQRQMGSGAAAPPTPQAASQPVPVVPPNPAPKIPQQAKRFANAQAIQDAYRNNWTPNPILLRAQLGHK